MSSNTLNDRNIKVSAVRVSGEPLSALSKISSHLTAKAQREGRLFERWTNEAVVSTLIMAKWNELADEVASTEARA